jgi:PAS domain S-box-containing protein
MNVRNPADPVAPSPLSTRRLVFALVLALVAVAWANAGVELAGGVRTLVIAREVRETNRAVDRLLQAAQNLAFERGRSNVVLRAAAPVDADNRAFIAARRHAVDDNMTAAMAMLGGQAARLTNGLAALAALRAEVDTALALPRDSRDAELADRWLATISSLLGEIEIVASEVTLGVDRFSPPFRILTRIKLQSLRLRNALGLESSQIAAAMVTGRAPDAASAAAIAQLHGESAAHWANLKREVALAGNPAISAARAQVERRVFVDFRPLQENILAAARDNTPPPLTPAQYVAASVPALDSVPALMAVVGDETQAYAQRNIEHATQAVVLHLAIALAALALGGGTVMVIVTRLLIPLTSLRAELKALEHGDLAVNLEPPGRRDEMGGMQAAVIAFRDSLAERQRMADELAQHRERLITLISALPDFVCFKDGDGRWLVVNDFGIQLFGLDGLDYLGRTDAELAEMAEHCRQPMCGCAESDARAWAKAGPLRGEEVVVGADGTARFFDVVKVPLYHADGSRKGLVVVGRDITERRRIEAALSRLSRQNELILECAGEGIVGLDAAGQAIFINPAAARMTGWDMGDLLGHIHHDLIHHSLADGQPNPGMTCPVNLTLMDGVARHVADDLFWRKDGTPFAVEFVVTPIIEQGQVRGAVMVFRDIAERKQAEREIGSLLDELKRSNADLEQFAYAVSHDLQEPLRMVSSFVQMLRRRYQDKLDSEADEFIGFAVDGAQRMSAMISSLLEFARINSRGQAPGPVDSGAALAQALDYLTLLVGENAVELTSPTAMPMVMGDFNQLVSVFQNLIGNAIKYRHPERPPRIHMAVERLGTSWSFAITDNGIGIPAAEASRVFGVFQRLRARPEVAGTGMGLAICKRIVERLGGRIRAEPMAEKGTRFVFTLPALPAAAHK